MKYNGNTLKGSNVIHGVLLDLNIKVCENADLVVKRQARAKPRDEQNPVCHVKRGLKGSDPVQLSDLAGFFRGLAEL